MAGNSGPAMKKRKISVDNIQVVAVEKKKKKKKIKQVSKITSQGPNQ